MAHFSNTLEVRKGTPMEWLRVGAQIGRLVNEWSFRGDLVVNLGETTSDPKVAALFNPASAEIEVNTVKAFGRLCDPDDIVDMTNRSTQFNYPVATGAIFHEALHARFSRWDIKSAHDTLGRREFESLILLEESRIESLGVRLMPSNRLFLRSSAMEIVLADLDDDYLSKIETAYGAGYLAGLTLARVDAGVLEPSDISSINEVLTTILGEDVIAQLREVWLEFQAHEDARNVQPLYDLATRWVEILEQVRKERGESEQEQPNYSCGHAEESQSGSGESGDGESDGESQNKSEGLGALIAQMREALEEAKDSVQISASAEIEDQRESEEWREQAQKSAEKGKQKTENEKVAKEVYGVGTGPAPDSATTSILAEVRKPNADERASAVKVARLLERAKYRERSAVEINSVIPAGRLRTRAVIQNKAMESRGLRPSAEPWRTTKRKHTETPELKVGVLVDISGSMRSAMNPMATTAWVLSEAVRRVQGKASMVYYGSSVFATLKPGQHLENVNVYTATDHTEKFDRAFKALDGAMNLVNGNGARLLVVVSDGQYSDDERKAARRWIQTCDKNGVAVLWIGFDGTYGSIGHKYVEGTNGKAILIDKSASASSVATLIGQSAADAITAVGKRNG